MADVFARLDINSGGKPIAFEVFKAGGVFSKDDVVKDESGQPQ